VVVEHAALEGLIAGCRAQSESPIVVDLETMDVSSGSLRAVANIPEAVRLALVEGRWDTTRSCWRGDTPSLEWQRRCRICPTFGDVGGPFA